MIRHYLRDRRCEFQECADGADVIPAYEKFLPDWVLMDWEMERVNGLTATSRLLACFPEARILIVTGYDGSALRQAALEVGARGFVLKDDLLALRSILDADKTV